MSMPDFLIYIRYKLEQLKNSASLVSYQFKNARTFVYVFIFFQGVSFVLALAGNTILSFFAFIISGPFILYALVIDYKLGAHRGWWRDKKGIPSARDIEKLKNDKFK